MSRKLFVGGKPILFHESKGPLEVSIGDPVVLGGVWQLPLYLTNRLGFPVSFKDLFFGQATYNDFVGVDLVSVRIVSPAGWQILVGYLAVNI